MLSVITDKRRKSGNFRHPLPEILFVIFSAALCGFEDWEMIEYYGKSQLEWLRLYYPYKNGCPSHDTMERLFATIEPKEFEKLLQELVHLVIGLETTTQIAIDGKRIRNSYDTYSGKPALHVVSAFATNEGLVLGQEKTEDKSNEITAIPILIEALDIENSVISIDAMGCQKDIVEKILKKKGDYLIAVKGNQKTLYEEIEQAFISQNPKDSNTTNDFGHGRIEKRDCKIICDMKFIDESVNWEGLKTVLKIDSERFIKVSKKTEKETRYYISSKETTAEEFNKLVRNHWKIENQLHWMLDVVFNEDAKRKRRGNSASNMNTLCKIVLPILKRNQTKKSIKNKRNMAALDPFFRDSLLNF
jgi:predicted transposase YbfD/YdcC